MTYDDFVAAAASALADDEFWCVLHPDGPLEETASKDVGAPVRLICLALDADWDDLCESGFSLGKIKKRAPEVHHVSPGHN